MAAAPMRNRRKRILILLLLSPLFFLLLFPFFERLRGRIALTRFKHHLASRGFKLTMAEFKSARPTGENGAPAFLQAAQQLRAGSVVQTNPPPRMELTPAGRAIVGFREEDWVEDKITNRWSEVAAVLEQNELALQLVRTALAKPVFDNNVDLTAGPNVVFVHLPIPKTASQWLAAQAQLSLHQGRNKEALENIIAQCCVLRCLEKDHILISELVRIAIAAIARTTVWEALQADGWSDADLAQLSQIWQSATFATNMTHDLEGELIFGLSEYDSMRKSNSNAVNSIYGMQKFVPPDDSERPSWERAVRLLPGGEHCADFVKEQIYCRLWRLAWLDQDEVHYLRFMEGLLDIAHRAESEKSLAAIEPDLFRLLEPATRTSFYNNLRYPQVSSFGILANSLKKPMKAETERSLILTAIALKRYSIRFGKPAVDLQSLVPEFLSSIPIDYMDGKPIKYRLDSDGTFVLYSVGEDYKDGRGDSSLQSGKTGTYNIWNRNDVVWPQPALPEEIETFRKEKRGGK
jgi:hypothetical protein